MRRGDLYLVDLDPARPSEANKRRPAVIVSADSNNRTAERLGVGTVTVVPVTSNTARIYDFQLLLPASDTGLDQDSKAQAKQVRTVSVSRLDRVPLGQVPAETMTQLDAALRLYLSL